MSDTHSLVLLKNGTGNIVYVQQVRSHLGNICCIIHSTFLLLPINYVIIPLLQRERISVKIFALDRTNTNNSV